MNTIITNAFSINMLAARERHDLHFRPLTVEEAMQFAVGAVSAVGHADTAAVFSAVLGVSVDANRVNVALEEGTRLLVGQYRGPRLPEGATELPEGATIEWWLVV